MPDTSQDTIDERADAAIKNVRESLEQPVHQAEPLREGGGAGDRNPHPIEEAFRVTPRHQLGASIPANSPLLRTT
jgi:hypothetical protein